MIAEKTDGCKTKSFKNTAYGTKRRKAPRDEIAWGSFLSKKRRDIDEPKSAFSVLFKKEC